MASTLKTPGVYIEEIVKFPPSVAQVETAIPAFIGYTEKATNKIDGDLSMTPTRITSLLEYERFFGGAKAETTIEVTVTDDSASNRTIVVTKPTSKEPFIMYYSLQLYFANGGGPCYITSVGDYSGLVVDTVLLEGLIEVGKVDEPTLLLFPDATRADGIQATAFYAIYNEALTQCNKLQDRFTIIDMLANDTSLPTDPNIAELRDKISSDKDFAKYGAVYYPNLETILNYKIDEDSLDVTLEDLAPDDPQLKVQNISDLIDTSELNTLIATDLADITSDVDGAAGDAAAVAFIPNLKENINDIIAYINSLQSSLNNALQIAHDEGSVTTEANDLDTWITDNLEQAILDLNKSLDRLNDDTTKAQVSNEIQVNKPGVHDVLGIHTDNGPLDALKAKIDTLIASGELKLMIDALPAVAGSSSSTVSLASLETSDNATYNKIKTEINNLPMELPPSSAIAGIYARVDSTRGVWKAPANVSLNYVVKPTVRVTNDIQDGLNVDVNAGKSINAIRSFTGKGVMVWGARTLAGNDNEWRYVSVRRFFNMVEESVKKASDQFVFEANDANTWVRIRSMIENFLTNQWKAGALAGATTDDAYYVKVGLNQTMTADDILNGIMNIEIGMAVVRPAEFIVLKFSHKMQES
ncbi:hypothetical protein IMCC3317_08400 [Kordia antarctica]|uniref:Tail sheath protein C-terminal domain-containing protein n=1 Tax=Kordia antarctica TaxID=1218801 RepID=A0A7L4ZHT7_9FLAO|nr:phage tail sheath C-terminal domain-containing protein [Kordia antarctica]QHI35494.1 hypothetical protein IMCC3317_08400 [Kordia antarctica]